MENDLISVIMAVYNSRDLDLLEQSIDSIIHQTYKNWELILCDDGSNEETKDVLSRLVQKDERIRFIENERNSGLAYSLNQCLQAARGTYIARQDDDDISKKNRFEVELQFLKTHPEYGFVGCAVELFDENGIWGMAPVIQEPKKENFLRTSPFAHPTIMVRRKVYDAVEGYRSGKETARCEDYDMFMRMYAMGIKGYNLEDSLYLYYQNAFSYKKTSLSAKVGEAKVRYHNFRNLGILWTFKGIMGVFRPILAGITPAWMKRNLYHRKYRI